VITGVWQLILTEIKRSAVITGVWQHILTEIKRPAVVTGVPLIATPAQCRFRLLRQLVPLPPLVWLISLNQPSMIDVLFHLHWLRHHWATWLSVTWAMPVATWRDWLKPRDNRFLGPDSNYGPPKYEARSKLSFPDTDPSICKPLLICINWGREVIRIKR
jgi:hypothetical protein